MKNKVAYVMVMLVLALVFVAAACVPKPQQAIKPADFYKGKTVDIVTTGTVGGYDDQIARVIASSLSADIGGEVLVTNKRGAGGMEGMNYVYRSEPDGLTLGMVASSKFILNKIMEDPVAEYDIERLSYIMSIGKAFLYFLVSPEGPYQSIADLQAAKDLKIAAGSPSGNIALAGMTFIKVFDLDGKVVTGFKGESSRTPAVARGEVAGYCMNMHVVRAGVESGMLKPLFVIATERDPRNPDIPAIGELVNLTGDDLALVQLWETELVSSTLLAAPPDISEDRLSFLRESSSKWIESEEFRNEINKVAGYEVDGYLTGEELSEKIIELVGSLDNYKAIFAEIIEKYRA